MTASLAAGSLFAFVVLGLPDGMLGVAWPALRSHFDQPLGGLGELLVAALVGYLAVTSAAGRLLARLGTGTVLVSSAVAGSAGTALFVLAPTWGWLVVGAVLIGVAGGGLDSALNTVMALAGRVRLVNLIHAAYGVGAALGPLAVTASLAATSSWRSAYGALFLLEGALVVVWTVLRHRFGPVRRVPRSARTAGERPAGDHRRRSLLVLSLLVFFCYTGLEVGVSSWSASYLRGPGGLSATVAGVVVFLYWAALTAGRAGAAALGSRLDPGWAARLGVAGSAAGAAVVWADLGDVPTVVGLVVMGLGLGPIFPALLNLTPARLGSITALDAIGWELGAASAGGAALSALMGLVLQLAGLDLFGPLLLGLAVVLGTLNVVVERLGLSPTARP